MTDWGTPEEMVRPAPCLGKHNEYVLREHPNMSDQIADPAAAETLEWKRRGLARDVVIEQSKRRG